MKSFFTLVFSLALFPANGQDISTYLKQNALMISDVSRLNDSVYNLLSRFQVLMVGEMHGTNEPAQLVIGLTDLLVNKGDNVQLGLEIPESQMTKYLASHTDSSIYLSDFFSVGSTASGRESFAWAKVISRFKNNPKVHVFFYDVNEGEYKNSIERDSLMYLKIKNQFTKHPTWKIVTISGNVHNMTKPEYKLGRNTMASFLKHDQELNISDKICSICHYYSMGTALCNYGDGLKIHRIGSPESEYSKALDFEKYIVLARETSLSVYTGIYYSKDVTAATMVKGNADFPLIRKELQAIYERDQKTRKGYDSAKFMAYIDSCNLVQMEAFIEKFGWPGQSLMKGANAVAFSVIQHANIEAQEKYFPLLQQSVSDGETPASHEALLQDRILMRRGKKQLFGSQISMNKETGAWEFWQIEDERNVNLRRAKAGLEPIEEYAKRFGIEYKLTKEQENIKN